VDIERPTYHERMRQQLAAFFVEPYVEKVSEEVEAEEVES